MLSVMSLQWSHDLSAMDTQYPHISSEYAKRLLQWSHDLSAMDTCYGMGCCDLRA